MSLKYYYVGQPVVGSGTYQTLDMRGQLGIIAGILDKDFVSVRFENRFSDHLHTFDFGQDKMYWNTPTKHLSVRQYNQDNMIEEVLK